MKHFSRKLIFLESCIVNRTQGSGWWLCSYYLQISATLFCCHKNKNILIDDFQHHPFLYQAKVLKIFILKQKITNCKDKKLTIQIFFYYLIDWGTRKVFNKIMQHISLRLGCHYGLTWDNLRQFFWDHFCGNIFQKIIPHILSNLSNEITWSWNQNCVISRSWDNFSSMDAKKHVWNWWPKHTF